MNLADIAGKVTAALGIDMQDNRERQIFNERIRNTLYRLRDRNALESLRDGKTVLWRTVD